MDSPISFIVNSLDSFFIIPALKFLEILEYFLTSVVLVEKDLFQTLHIKRCLSRQGTEIKGILSFTLLWTFFFIREEGFCLQCRQVLGECDNTP